MTENITKQCAVRVPEQVALTVMRAQQKQVTENVKQQVPMTISEQVPVTVR